MHNYRFGFPEHIPIPNIIFPLIYFITLFSIWNKKKNNHDKRFIFLLKKKQRFNSCKSLRKKKSVNYVIKSITKCFSYVFTQRVYLVEPLQREPAVEYGERCWGRSWAVDWAPRNAWLPPYSVACGCPVGVAFPEYGDWGDRFRLQYLQDGGRRRKEASFSQHTLLSNGWL